MSQYVVAYVAEEGEQALSLSVSLGNDEQGRQFASRTAQRCHAVSLFAVDDEGFTLPMAEWLNGVLTSRNGISPQVIDGEVDLNSAMGNLREAAEQVVAATESLDEDSDAEIADAVSADEDESHHYTARCFHCKENREFVGRVVELANGSKQAQGTCPVCGGKVVRMVARSTPVDEWDEEPEGNADDTDETPVEVSDEQTEIAEAISEVVEGEPIAEVAEQVTELAAEFSHAAEEVEQQPAKKATAKKAPAKAQPAKKQTPAKKAAPAKDGRTANQRGAASTEKAKCPKCEQDVDVIVRGGLKIYSLHADEAHGLDRCPGSTTVLPGQGV